MASEALPHRTPAPAAQGDLRLLLALCLASFLAALNFFVLSPFYPAMARDLDTTVPLLGQATTLMILISASLGLVVGPLADRYGYRRLLVVGVIAVSAALIGEGLAPSYPILLCLTVFGGLADALLFGLPLAIAGTRFHGDQQRKAMSWTIASLSAAPIVGIPIVTSFGAVTGWRAALVTAGVLSVLTAPFIANAIPADSDLQRGRIHIRDVLSSYRPLLRHRDTVRLYGATAARAILVISYIAYLGAFLEDEVGLRARYVGFVFMASGIANVTGNLVGGRLHVGSTRRGIISAFLLSAGAVAVLFSVDSLAAVVPLLMVASFSNAIAGFGTTTLLATETRGGTGTTMVLNGSILNFGAAAGAGLGGLLLGIGGYEALAIGLPLFGIAAAVLIAWPNRD